MKKPLQVQSNLIMMVFRSTYIEEQIGKIMIIRFEKRPVDVRERHSRAKFLQKKHQLRIKMRAVQGDKL